MIGLAVDIGTANTKMGFVGESQPRLQTDSIYLSSENQRTISHEEQDFFSHHKEQRLFAKDINIWRTDVTAHKIFQQHWQQPQLQLQLSNHALRKEGCLQFIRSLVGQMKQLKQKHNHINEEVSQYGLLVIEPTYLKKYEVSKYRETLSHFFFEELHLSSAYFIKSSVCTAYSEGRTTAVVVDSGHNFTSISRVIDGYNEKSINLNFGGNIIAYALQAHLASKNLTDRTNFINPKGRCPHFDQLCKDRELTSLKKCFKVESSQDIEQQGKVTLEFADESSVQIGRNQILQPFTQLQQFKKSHQELYFPEKYYSVARYAVQLLEQENGPHIDTIILTGGNMLYSNLANRIADQIGRLLANRNIPGVRIVKSKSALISGWIGGSIAGSTQNFPLYWCTASEYREQGLSVINKKCPL